MMLTPDDLIRIVAVQMGLIVWCVCGGLVLFLHMRLSCLLSLLLSAVHLTL